jgi:hypothetical protein
LRIYRVSKIIAESDGAERRARMADGNGSPAPCRTHGGPTMFARIGIMRALNRRTERVIDLSRKDHHWGRRRLARDHFVGAKLQARQAVIATRGLSFPR